jgi:hypothetical protein
MRQLTLLVRLWAPDNLDPVGVVDEVQQVLDMGLEHGIKDAEVYLDEGDDET